MKKKISISTLVTLVLLSIALTVSLTMLLSMRHFNSQLQLVSQRQAMYSHINDVDKKVREYYPNLDEELLRQSIAQGYVYGLGDPYAAYYSPERYAAEQLRLSGWAKNVGVTLSQDSESRIVVSRVAADSSAEKWGVKVGDIVTAVDDVPVEGQTLFELQSAISTADKVMLSVRRGEGASAYTLEATEYAVHTVTSETLGSIGYVKISAFYENTPVQFKDVVTALLDQGVSGIVFDLRNNAGGSPEAVQEMLSYIMPLGAYGTMTNSKGEEVKLSTKESKQLDLPTATLINSGTAGEAEFFAGVLKDMGLTTVMGQTSAGKAKYQEYFVLEQDLSALKLTVGEYGLMKSGSWEGKGIVPAVEVTLPPDQSSVYPMLPAREDAQVQAAVDKLEEISNLPGDNTTTPQDPPVGGTTTAPDGTTVGGTTTTTAVAAE